MGAVAETGARAIAEAAGYTMHQVGDLWFPLSPDGKSVACATEEVAWSMAACHAAAQARDA